jgi:regulation of enolase protein 1 (concanavalin A-like superfamily)
MSGRVPGALRARLGDDATFGLIEMLDSERKDWSDQVLTAAADKFERRLSEELSVLRVELHDGLSSVRQELATTRVEMLKWSFLFWLGQVAAMAGLLGFMLRRP